MILIVSILGPNNGAADANQMTFSHDKRIEYYTQCMHHAEIITKTQNYKYAFENANTTCRYISMEFATDAYTSAQQVHQNTSHQKIVIEVN